MGLWFVAFLLLGEHCVEEFYPPDFYSTGCSGVHASELPLTLAVTTPIVLAGVAAVKSVAWLRRRSGGAGAGATAR